jgi:hypothetical protein
MVKKRVPDYKQIEVTKSPKNIENPSQYKDFPLAWQLGFIDDESKWGTSNFREFFSLGNYDDMLKQFPDDIHNDLLDAVEGLIGKRFRSLNDLLTMVGRKSNNNITTKEQQIILNFLNENPFWIEIYPKIRHFEITPWHILEREQYGKKGKTKHHYVSVSNIIPEAQKRLQKLKLDDIDQLFSIRLDGELRIYGIRKFSYFRVLWIDFDHEIYPSSRN